MERYTLPGTTETIFYRNGRRRALEARLRAEGVDIMTLIRDATFRGVALLVQYGVDRGVNGFAPGDDVLPPAIEMSEADALIDQAVESGAVIAEFGAELMNRYMGMPAKKSDDAGATSGPVPTTTPTSP